MTGDLQREGQEQAAGDTADHAGAGTADEVHLRGVFTHDRAPEGLRDRGQTLQRPGKPHLTIVSYVI
ncbi:hypothetical protein GCM10028775_00150 [Catellatospora paridis]